jgi:uncharacterized protein (TIGR00251 family)
VAGEVLLTLYVQPGAGRTGFAGTFDGVPKLRLAARARDGEANDELVRFLSRSLRVPRTSIEIVSGSRSRRKRVRIEGDAAAIGRALEGLLR